jgi:peptide/nickel transport system permease protein
MSMVATQSAGPPPQTTPSLDSMGTRALGTRGSIRRMLLGRLLVTPIVLLGVSFLVFVLAELSGNDPAYARLGPYATDAQRHVFAIQNHLNRPLIERYGNFLNDTIHLRLGQSLTRPETVGVLIRGALPATLQLTLLASVIAVLVSATLGSVAAMNDGRRVDKIISWAMAIGQSLPDFVLAVIVLEVFGVVVRVIPVGGYSPLSHGFGPWLSHLIAPASVLAVPFIAAMTRVVRASLVEELSKDYVRTARGAGVPPTRMMIRNVLPNALLPPLTMLGLRISWLLGGAILVENVFSIPGVGFLLITAVKESDLAVIRAVAVLGGVVVVVLNALVDVAYTLVNPKLRRGAGV